MKTAGEAQHHEPEYSKLLNLSATSASAGAATISTATPKMPPSAENTRPEPSASFGAAAPGQQVGLVGIGGTGRRARHAQQRARDVAAEDGHRGGGDDGRHRRHRRHEEGHRHQQRGGHGRRQPGDGADEQAIQRRQRDHQQHVGLEYQPEGGLQGIHRGG
jgi:hypothetical protein